jgi:uncharacterized protein
MELQHTFTVPVPPQQAFAVLRDIRRIGPCMPGATIDEVEGDAFTGTVKVKLGPITVSYRGEAEYRDVDPDGLRASIVAKGKESRGAGTATAVVHARLREVGRSTEVEVVTDLTITGRPAQFGRGVMKDVGEKLIGQFADCLAATLGEDDATPAESPPAGAPSGDREPSVRPADPADAPAGAAGPSTATSTDATPPAPPAEGATVHRVPPREAEAIDLLDVAGGSVAKRVLPVAAALAALWLLLRRRRR